jgi:hypothetical protein
MLLYISYVPLVHNTQPALAPLRNEQITTKIVLKQPQFPNHVNREAT